MNTRYLVPGALLVTALFAGTLAVAFARPRDSVKVIAQGPGGIRIEGSGSRISVEEDGSALVFRVPLSPLETAAGLRDVTLRHALDADRHPAAALRVQRAELIFPHEQRPFEGAAEGEFELRGESHPVRIRYKAALTPAGEVHVAGSLQLDLRDYGVEDPTVFGLGLSPFVEVEASFDVPAGLRRAEGVSELR
jgi:hypothetical protein